MNTLDPRTRLLLFILVIMTLYATPPRGTLWIALWLVGAWVVTDRQPPRWRDLVPRSVLLLAFFSLATHAVWSPAPYLIAWGVIRLSAAGITRGLLLACRLLITASAAKLLAESTSPLELADALRWLLSPIERVGLRLPDLPMLMAIGARFAPELGDDARRLIALRQLRRSEQNSSNARTRLRGIGQEIIVPLFRLSFRRASILGDALALRHYHPHRRQSLPAYAPTFSDGLAWGVTLGFCLLAWFA